MSKKLFIIIDANSIFYRAYHALPRFTTKSGELVNAVYGFGAILLKVLKEFKPDYMAAAFDVEGPVFREVEYKEYKATREKMPDELFAQMPRIKKMLDVFNIPIYEKQGYEADDIIGTVAEKLKTKKDTEILIVSGDLDTLQLIGDNAKVYTMRKGVADTIVYDAKATEKKFALKPEQLTDYKGLRGDASDNIPGVPGVGEKTAAQLLQKFGRVENLYKELENREPGKIEGISARMHNILLENKSQALLSKKLGTIKKDVPIKFNLEDAQWGGFDVSEVEKFLRALNFNALLARVGELKGFEGLQLKPKTGGIEERRQQLLEQVEQAQEAQILSPQIYELEKELVDVVIKMEERGIGIDKLILASLGKNIQKELSQIEKDIYKISGRVFNINSPAQLAEILFEKLKIDTKGIKKTGGGKISTAAPELEKLKGRHKIIERILQQRELQKLLSTYLKPLAELADKDGRLHTTFKPLGTATGRMASVNPNLQNIPIRGKWGEQIRKAFIAKEGKKFLICDYSQIELRITAHLSQDKNMIEAFKKDEDIHTNTAAYIFGVAKDKVDSQMRYRAKALNFGIIYGIGPRAFAQSAGISFEEAQEFIQRYFDIFEGVASYMEETKNKAHQLGYTETIFGRKRFLPDLSSPNPMLRSMAERAAINHPAQGTAADIVKMAMVETDKKFGKDIDLLLQIHDELLWEGDEAEIKRLAPQVQKVLESIVKLDVPLKATYFIGSNWGEKS